MAPRTKTLLGGLRLAEALVVVLATVGAIVLLTFFGVSAVLDGIKLVAP